MDNPHNQPAHDAPNAAPFGEIDGRQAQQYTLKNRHGLIAQVSDFGATLVSMQVPDRDGIMADLTHGYDDVYGYESDRNPYFGATIGRFGNRIAHGKFSLDGKTYRLTTNSASNGIPCHHHGGLRGFNRRFWQVAEVTTQSIQLQYLSPANEEGYPGNLSVIVTYTLNDENEMIWDASATTDAPTPVNLVHHSYWNLSGDPLSHIDDHELTLWATHFLPTNAGQIPTGELAAVTDTPMDFTSPTPLGDRIDDDFEALRIAAGYDHAWVLDGAEKYADLTRAASVRHPASGRVMDVFTNQPAIHLYTGNFLNADDFMPPHQPGKNGIAYPRRSALCLETEAFPNAPNQPSFPNTILRPGEAYQHRTIHRFTTD